MTFQQMLPVLQSQTSRVFNGDKDGMQDALAMAFENYQNCLANHARQLSIGECVKYIKYRASELKNGKRPHFGNLSNKRTNDIYYRGAYLNGEVERLSFDYSDGENEEDDRGTIHWATRVHSPEAEILFGIDFKKFLTLLNPLEQSLLSWCLDGYTVSEISRMVNIGYFRVRSILKKIGLRFSEYFQCGTLATARN